MAVVKEYKHNECTVRIHDDYFLQTQEEINQCLKELAVIVQKDYARRMMQKEQEERKALEKNA